MAIRAVLARRSRYDRETIVLETIVLPIKLPARINEQFIVMLSTNPK